MDRLKSKTDIISKFGGFGFMYETAARDNEININDDAENFEEPIKKQIFVFKKSQSFEDYCAEYNEQNPPAEYVVRIFWDFNDKIYLRTAGNYFNLKPEDLSLISISRLEMLYDQTLNDYLKPEYFNNWQHNKLYKYEEVAQRVVIYCKGFDTRLPQDDIHGINIFIRIAASIYSLSVNADIIRAKKFEIIQAPVPTLFSNIITGSRLLSEYPTRLGSNGFLNYLISSNIGHIHVDDVLGTLKRIS